MQVNSNIDHWHVKQQQQQKNKTKQNKTKKTCQLYSRAELFKARLR